MSCVIQVVAYNINTGCLETNYKIFIKIYSFFFRFRLLYVTITDIRLDLLNFKILLCDYRLIERKTKTKTKPRIDSCVVLTH